MLSRSPRLAPLMLATMAAQSLLVVLSPTMVDVGREFGASVGAVGQARAITAASAVAASLLVAGLVDRAGLRRLLTVGAVLAVVGSTTSAAAPSLTAFLVAHGVTGIAFACLLSAALAGVAAFPRRRSTRAMGYVIGANALAWVVAGPLGGALTDTVSWRAAHAVPAALALAALTAARWVTPVSAVAAPGPRTPWLGVLANRRARRWLVAELAAWFVWAAELTYGGAFLTARHSVSESAVGALFAVAAAAFFFGSVRSAPLARHLARRRLIAAAALAMATLIPLQFNVAPSVWVSLAFLCVIALCAGIRSSAAAALGLAQMPGQPGAMMAAQTAVTQLGYLLGALAGAGVLSSSGYAGLGLLLGGGLLVSAALFTRVVDPLEQPVQSASAAGSTTVIERPGRRRIQPATAPAAGAAR
jgi:predicted MFS family arabinose efflux permease